MRAAAVQLNATEDTARNRETADRLVRAAAARGAELVVLPEKWTAMGDTDVIAAAAEPFDGPTVGWARAVARELGIDLVAGSFVEAVPGESRARNTSVHVGPDGDVRGAYRKLHLFDVEVAGVEYRESATEAPGAEIVASRLADGTGLGLTICYDLRFPELYRVLALRGATVISLVSAFTLATTRDHWEVLVRARAIEEQCFLVAANQFGRHTPAMTSGGRSMIVDPWGIVLAQAPDAEGVIVADLDLGSVEAVRRRIPALDHRRPEAYGWPAEAGA
ncbi:MAG: carbon-nitrogen hydrolase family protein [Solirubrobacteraceae bacterium]